MRVAVTGATGLLGNNLVRALIHRGDSVVAIARKAQGAPALAGLEVQACDADIADWSSIDRGCTAHLDAVIHCAAHIHLGWSRMQEALRVNVEGTRNALRLAAERGARFVHVSTVNTLAVGSPSSPADEETLGDGQVPSAYVVSKRAAEAEVRSAIDRGADAIVVYPGLMLGPWDWKPSSGRMILELRRGAPPWAPSGGISLCDARDVAATILTALQRASRGSRYILAGENWTYFDFWSEITTRLKSRPPRIAMRAPARWVAGTAGDWFGRITGTEPIVNSAALAMSAQHHWYSSARAIRELGYVPRDARESLSDTIAWLAEHGFLASSSLASSRKVS